MRRRRPMQKPGPTAQVRSIDIPGALKARNKRMSQSLSSVLIHLVFSTKNREPFITPAIESELHPYMASIFRRLKSPSLVIDGTMDHVHILFSLGRIISIADLVEE